MMEEIPLISRHVLTGETSDLDFASAAFHTSTKRYLQNQANTAEITEFFRKEGTRRACKRKSDTPGPSCEATLTSNSPGCPKLTASGFPSTDSSSHQDAQSKTVILKFTELKLRSCG